MRPPAGVGAIDVGVVTEIDPVNREAIGTSTFGGIFRATYYGTPPAVADDVVIGKTTDGTWVVLVGPSNAAGLFGIGGDGTYTLTATSTFTAARTTSADATASGTTKQTLTSASAAFTSADIGSLITGTGITAGTTITGVTSTTVCTTSYPTSCSSAAVTITPISGPFVAATNETVWQMDEAVATGAGTAGASGTVVGIGSTIYPVDTKWVGYQISGTVNGNAIAAGTTITGVTGSSRTVASVVTSTSVNISYPSNAFTSADIGSLITGTGIPANTYLVSLPTSTTGTISQATTSSTTITATLAQVYSISNVTGIHPWSTTFVAAMKLPTITLQRDAYLQNLTLDPTNGRFALRTNGYRLFVAGTTTINYGCRLHNDGYPGLANAAGNGAPAGSIGGGANGGAGKTSGSGNGTAGSSNATYSIATTSSSSVLAGGWGGDQFSSNPSGASGGSISNALATGFPATLPQIITLRDPSGNLYVGGAGGGGGGGGSITGGYSGGGGGGGGIVFLATRTLINFGSLTASGGYGGNAKLGTSTTCAGGGGGSGGAVVLIFGASGSTPGAVSAASGASGGGYGTSSSYRTGGYGAYLAYFTMYGQTGSIVIPASPGVQGVSNGGGPAGSGLNGMIWALPV